MMIKMAAKNLLVSNLLHYFDGFLKQMYVMDFRALIYWIGMQWAFCKLPISFNRYFESHSTAVLIIEMLFTPAFDGTAEWGGGEGV